MLKNINTKIHIIIYKIYIYKYNKSNNKYNKNNNKCIQTCSNTLKANYKDNMTVSQTMKSVCHLGQSIQFHKFYLVHS